MKVFRNDVDSSADAQLQTYLNSVDASKVIRGLGVSRSSADNLVIVLVIDA